MRYGQYHVAEPWHNLALLHQHAGGALRTTTHEPPLAVLEQENFGAQGITVAALVPGAQRGTDALGNCVYNAGTAAVSCLGLARYNGYLGKLGLPLPPDPFADARTGEEAAIVAYHRGTDATGTTSSEWPPNDCGSSGVYLVDFLRSIGAAASQRVAHGATNIVSLHQTGPVLEGTPFFYAWETPGPGGFVDGNGSASALEAAIRSGVAGGHETLQTAVEKLVLTATGQATAAKTVVRVRNSWGRSWGDAGSFRIHLSTLVALGGQCDFRQLVAA